MKKSILLITAALGLGAVISFAQDAGGRGPGAPGGPGGPRGPRQGPAIIGALDANKDGKLDATEIANASAALKTLDKNNDGELAPEEMFGARPDGERGGPGGIPRQRPAPPTQQ